MECVTNGLPLSRRSYRPLIYDLGGGVAAPDLVTVKDFIRFYIFISRGRIVGKFTADSVNTFAEWPFASFTRVTDIPINNDERSEVHRMRPSPLSDLSCSRLICS
jgi:hypothetical protein